MINQIVKGFYNNLTNKEVNLFDYRIAICRKCTNIKDGLLGETCKICGCVLQSKCRVKEATCPENKW